jgi:hypothetical protein
MVYFTEIIATKHYLEEHSNVVPWEKVVELIFTTKNPRKNGDSYIIERSGYYVVFSVNENILRVINAKFTNEKNG